MGYHRSNCSETCIAPTYGEDCQLICECPDDECNFITGCSQNVGTVTDNRHLRMLHLSI